MIGYIDYPTGTHGHFLSYVLNVFVLKTTQHKQSPFDQSGAAHLLSKEYLSSRLVHESHYSEKGIKKPNVDKVIQIEVLRKDFPILVANTFYRAGNIEENSRMSDLEVEYNNKTSLIRNVMYSKFLESDTYTGIEKQIKLDEVDNSLKINMSDLYNLSDFVGVLHDIAYYLNHRFFMTEELISLWDEFIEKNQGFQMHQKCRYVMDKVLRGIETDFEFNIMDQAYFNMMLSKNEHIFDGPLFQNDLYPTNTSVIINMIKDFKNNFDKVFPA